MRWRQQAECQRFDHFIADAIAERMQCIRQHVPASRRGKRFFMLGRFAPQMIGSQLDIFDHPWMNATLVDRPLQPLAMVGTQMNMRETIDQCRRHRLHDRRILGAIAGTDHDGSFR